MIKESENGKYCSRLEARMYFHRVCIWNCLAGGTLALPEWWTEGEGIRMNNRKQLKAFLIMLFVYAFCIFATYAFFTDQIAASANIPMPELPAPPAVMGLASAGIYVVLYGLLGWAGYWFARKLELPGIFSEDGNGRRWFLIPLLLGLACGVVVVIGDYLFAPINGLGRFPHPPFPLSILASMTAGIGEEILFRGFVFGLWGFILHWLLKHLHGHTAALWIANIIAALAFGAGHLPTLFFLTGASSPAELNPVLLAEVFLLNGAIGLIAGQRYMKDGLVAATGIHFWADMVFHVVWGLL
jgi:membrane protease YdiL (CAAX protease family)